VEFGVLAVGSQQAGRLRVDNAGDRDSDRLWRFVPEQHIESVGDLIQADLSVDGRDLIVRDEKATLEHAELDGCAAEIDRCGAHVSYPHSRGR